MSATTDNPQGSYICKCGWTGDKDDLRYKPTKNRGLFQGHCPQCGEVFALAFKTQKELFKIVK